MLSDFQSTADKITSAPAPDFHAAIANVATDEEQKSFWQSAADFGKGMVSSTIGLGEDIAKTAYPEFGQAKESIAALRAQDASLDPNRLRPEIYARLRESDAATADQLQSVLGDKPTMKKWAGDIGGTLLNVASVLPIGEAFGAARMGLAATKEAEAANIAGSLLVRGGAEVEGAGMLKVASTLQHAATVDKYLKAAVAGGGWFAGFSAADAASQDKSLGDIAKAAGVGALVGAPLGVVAPLLGHGLIRAASIEPFVNAYNKVGEMVGKSEKTRFLRDFFGTTAGVLQRDLGQTGKDIVRKLNDASANATLGVARVTKTIEDLFPRFGSNDAGRSAAKISGQLLEGLAPRLSPVEDASQFKLGVTTFRSARAENLSKEAYDLASTGDIIGAARKVGGSVDEELGTALRGAGIKEEGTLPTIGYFDGSKEPSVQASYFGTLDDKALGEIASFGDKANQDAITISRTHVNGVRVTKADPEASPALRISIPGLDHSQLDELSAKIQAVTDGKIGKGLTMSTKTGAIEIQNFTDFDGLTREEFEGMMAAVKNEVAAAGGKTQTYYTRNLVLTKDNYGGYIKKLQGPESAGAGAGAAAGSSGRPRSGIVTGRVGDPLTPGGKRPVGFGAQEALPLAPKDLPADLKGLTREQVYRAVLDDVYAEAEATGVHEYVPARKGAPAHFEPVTNRANFFPHVIPQTDDLRARVGVFNRPGRMRKWVIENAVEHGAFKDTETATRALDGYIEFIDKNGKGVSKQNGWVDYMVSSGQSKTRADAERVMRQIVENKGNVKMAGSLEHARVVNNPFYNPFPDEVLPAYLADSFTRMENIRNFGVEYSGASPKTPSLDAAIQALKEMDGKGVKDVEKAKKFLEIAMERINNSSPESRFSHFLTATQVPKLSYAAIPNLAQSLNSLMTSDFASTFYGLGMAFKHEGNQAALASGAKLQAILNEQAKTVAGGGNFADKLLKTVGFIWTEKFNRTVASNTGMRWVERNFDTVLKDASNQTARGRLSELGVDVDAALKRGSLTMNDKLKAGQIFSDKTQFRSRPMDLPYWASSPIGKLFWQFKNFTYQQTKFLGDQTVQEIRKGNYGRASRNFLLLATLFPLGGEVTQDLRSLVTQSRRPTNAIERYYSDLASAGGLGMIGDLFDATRFDQMERLLIPPALSSIASLGTAAYKGGNTLVNELMNQTGVLSPVKNVLTPRPPGRASSLESIGDMMNQ